MKRKYSTTEYTENTENNTLRIVGKDTEVVKGEKGRMSDESIII